MYYSFDPSTYLTGAFFRALLNNPFFYLISIPTLVGTFVAWCCLLKKAGVPWGFNFIPFFGEFCHYKVADSVDLFITRWCVIVGTISAALIHLNLWLSNTLLDPSGFVVFIYLPSAVVLLVVHAIFSHRLAEAYGRTSAFGSGLFWLHRIYVMILGFSKRSRHYTAAGTSAPSRSSSYTSGSPTPKPKKPAVPDWHCLACGASNPDSLRFCGHCGVTRGTRPERLPEALEAPVRTKPTPVPPPVKRPATWRCPACGADVPENLRFCSSCGKIRNEAPPAVPARPAAPAAPTPAVPTAPAPAVPVKETAPEKAPAVDLKKAPPVNLKKEPDEPVKPIRPVLEDVIPEPEPRTEAPVLETEDTERHWKCTVCGAYMPEGTEVCTICGVNRGPDAPVMALPDSWWFCAACGTRNADRHQTCTNCGAPR